MSKLEDILQEEALAEINSVLSEADAKAGALIREAEEQASQRVAAFQKTIDVEARASDRRGKSAAELTLAKARMQAKGRAIALVKEKVLAGLEEVGRKPNYGEILVGLAEEAMKVLEAPEAVVVHPDDQTRISAWANQNGLELRTDPGVRLGVRMVARGGQRSVENSLPERLQRAWESLAPGVAERLWGGVSDEREGRVNKF